MKICKKCLLNSNYPDLSFNSEGICSLCEDSNIHTPYGEEKLINLFKTYKNNKSEYDALVPISGGKDSTYILHLAVNVYKLKVITMTYDNGLLSDLAKKNIETCTKKLNVKHIYCKPDFDLQKKVFKNILLQSGDICGACDIATKANIIKVAREYKVPMILYGTSPLEEDSFVPDSIQDITRFKYILKQTKNFTKKEISDFLVYPNLNLFKLSFWKKTGKIGKEISPLFYIENPTDNEMGEIIKAELDWEDNDASEYSKHFDCIAEPLTNYIRNKIYGYERRVCQYSNMIRRDEISKDKAIEMYEADNIDEKPINFKDVLNVLDISEENLKDIEKIPALKYEKHTSKINRLFIYLTGVKQKFC